MSPKKHPLCHQNNTFSKCPIKICVITVVILGILPLMTVCAHEPIKNSSFSLIQVSSHYLPTDTETESLQSPRLLPVTKVSSASGTTSTVRPWPSHNFFRNVLSRSDNVVPKKRNRSTSRRKSNESGISSQNRSTLHLKDHDKVLVSKEVHLKTNDTKKLLQNRKKQHPSVAKPDKLSTISSKSTRARSVLAALAKPSAIVAENASIPSTIITQRKFSSPARQEKSQSVPESNSENGVNQQAANVTTLSQAEDLDANGMNTHTNESSPRINSPQVGFQYEILVPPPVFPPRPTPSELTVSLNHRPTSTAIPTMLQHESHYDSSGRNTSNADEGASSKNNRNTSNFTISAVNVNDMEKKNVTNDDAPTTTPSPPIPLGSQLEGSKNAETAATSTALPSLLGGSYNKSNEIILQYPQYPSAALLPSSRPPTQPLQLDTYLVKGNSSVERATYSNKSHLPHSLEGDPGNVSETHVEIKKNEKKDPWTINHNSGNSTDSSANKESLGETTTFLPILKRDREQNSSSVNTLTSLVSHITTTFPSFTTTTTPLYAWKVQPTHFSFQSAQPTYKPEQMQTERTGNMSIEKTFQKRISQQRFDNQKEINSANANYPVIHNQKPVMKSQTALINRRNMFTVVKAGITNPRIRVESRNVTTTSTTTTTAATRLNVQSSTLKSVLPGYPFDMLLYDRTNQVERPSLTTSILAGPDRMMASMSPGYAGKDNDYFDEDDEQVNLHHWIEAEQGHFVTPSTELPRFTNLTWPYNIPTAGSGNSVKSDITATGNAAGGGSPSAALSVSFNGQKQEKQGFEFYIPSAAADPKQNPILLAKKPTTNKIAPVTSSYESWTLVPTIQAVTSAQQLENGKQGLNNLKQSDHKSKIKHSHWGSKGLSSMKPPNSANKVKPPVSANQIKVYESSTGSPKSTPSAFSPVTFTKAPAASTFTIFGLGNKQQQQHQKHFSLSTAPSSSSLGSSTSSWPFAGGDTSGLVGQSETASFVTSKTPTNIWYKPIINHFTASVPFPGNTTLFDSINDQILKNVQGIGGGTFITTTMQPPSTRRKGYVGGNDDDDVDSFPVNTNKIDKSTFPGKFSGSRRNATGISELKTDDSENPILFKVWNLVDGKLKLENQREIPAWALQGYLIPSSGTILNLQQIPPSLQPLVTSAMAMNKEKEIPLGSEIATTTVFPETSSYIWKPLPIRGRYSTSSTKTSSISTTATAITAVTATSITNSDESLFDNNESNRIKMAASKMGWHAEETETMHSASKQPISINYVLWNNPASIYGQSIILSTPSPQTLLSHQPTPLSYFPSSTITSLVENTPQFSVPSVVTIKNPSGGGSSFATTTTTTTQRTSPASNNVDQEKLELLFQNYFQYFITTSTPAPTTTTTQSPISLANKVVGTYGQDEDNSKAWRDLKKLILRLASTQNDNSDKASATLDKDKTGDLDYLGNVAAIALIMSYLRNQYEKGSAVTSSTTPVPYGVTDDMTPPNKDQLWATVYPLFQHFLNNPNYTFIPPPPPPLKSSNQQLLSESTSSMGSMTPTSPGPIPFTEPLSVTGSSNYFSENTEFNHYASYYPTITTASPRTTTSIPHISITDVSWHGATTGKTGRSSRERNEEELDDYLDDVETTTQKSKTLLLLKKLKKKKKKKKDPLTKALFLGGLLKKKLPLFHIKKKPKKYWLDLKFEIDFIDLIKKKLLFMLAYKYMPVVMVLAFGVTPVVLSLVPLLYKMLWMKWKKPKYIKVPFPKPYPVPVFRHSPPPVKPFLYGHGHHHEHYPPPPNAPNFHRPEIRYENEQEHSHNDDVIHVNSPPQLPPTPLIMDHHYAADTMANGENSKEDSGKYAYKNLQLPVRENGGDYPGTPNSFNYDYVSHSFSDAAAATHAKYPHSLYNPNQDQEIHVHLHDDESVHHPTYQAAPPATYSPSSFYTSYTQKDLQPYPVTKSYEMGFDLGKTLAGITNKHDMEIFKILMETKKEKLNRLLEMWNLAKYGAAVASEAAVNTVNALRGTTTPQYADAYAAKKKKRKRRKKRRRKKRKHPTIETSSSSNNVTVDKPSRKNNHKKRKNGAKNS